MINLKKVIATVEKESLFDPSVEFCTLLDEAAANYLLISQALPAGELSGNPLALCGSLDRLQGLYNLSTDEQRVAHRQKLLEFCSCLRITPGPILLSFPEPLRQGASDLEKFKHAVNSDEILIAMAEVYHTLPEESRESCDPFNDNHEAVKLFQRMSSGDCVMAKQYIDQFYRENQLGELPGIFMDAPIQMAIDDPPVQVFDATDLVAVIAAQDRITGSFLTRNIDLNVFKSIYTLEEKQRIVLQLITSLQKNATLNAHVVSKFAELLTDGSSPELRPIQSYNEGAKETLVTFEERGDWGGNLNLLIESGETGLQQFVFQLINASFNKTQEETYGLFEKSSADTGIDPSMELDSFLKGGMLRLDTLLEDTGRFTWQQKCNVLDSIEVGLKDIMGKKEGGFSDEDFEKIRVALFDVATKLGTEKLKSDDEAVLGLYREYDAASYQESDSSSMRLTQDELRGFFTEMYTVVHAKVLTILLEIGYRKSKRPPLDTIASLCQLQKPSSYILSYIDRQYDKTRSDEKQAFINEATAVVMSYKTPITDEVSKKLNEDARVRAYAPGINRTEIKQLNTYLENLDYTTSQSCLNGTRFSISHLVAKYPELSVFVEEEMIKHYQNLDCEAVILQRSSGYGSTDWAEHQPGGNNESSDPTKMKVYHVTPIDRALSILQTSMNEAERQAFLEGCYLSVIPITRYADQHGSPQDFCILTYELERTLVDSLSTIETESSWGLGLESENHTYRSSDMNSARVSAMQTYERVDYITVGKEVLEDVQPHRVTSIASSQEGKRIAETIKAFLLTTQ